MRPSEIKAAYQQLQPEGHFFDRGTMKFFGDTMSSFGVRTIGADTYLYRKPTARVNVFGNWKVAGRTFFNAWRFDPSTGELDRIHDDAELTYIYNRVAK